MPGCGFIWASAREDDIAEHRTATEKQFEWFRERLRDLELPCSDGQLETLREYQRAIRDWNRRVNLVSRRDIDRLVGYHFLDSAEGLRYVRKTEDRTILDLGSGAGFPGVIWKILRPDLTLILVDSVRKRTLFLERVINGLNLRRIRVVGERGENLSDSPDLSGSCDVVVSRTVARLERLVEISFPLLRVGGRLVAFKGARLEEEQAEAGPVLLQYGGSVVSVESARSSPLCARRRFVVIEKRARE